MIAPQGVLAREFLRGFRQQLTQRVVAGSGWDPLPYQVPPDGDWNYWGIVGGRGIGKTRTGVEYVMDHLRRYGPRARVGIGAPTFGDARDTCAEGQSGFHTLYGSEFLYYNRSLGEAKHIGGGFIKLLGSEEPGRWNGPQWTLLWADELALWNEASWDMAEFGLRLPLPDGNHPRAIFTTTPKARQFVRKLSQQDDCITTGATTADNPYLDERAKSKLYKKYGGTTLGRQELLGHFLEEAEDAYWSRAILEEGRVTTASMQEVLSLMNTMRRTVVAIDPAGTHKKESAFTGITVAGEDLIGAYYVPHIGQYKLSPDGWANKAIELYDEFKADAFVVEVNHGGEMVANTIKHMWPGDRIPPKIIEVNASRGKATRAEPVAALYQQGHVHHVGMDRVKDGEDQMVLFPNATEYKDMVDSLVWALTELYGSQKIYGWDTGKPDRQSPWRKNARKG